MIITALTLVSRKGREYFRSDYDGSWWIRYKWDKPNKFVGAEHNLPKEIKRQLLNLNRYARKAYV